MHDWCTFPKLPEFSVAFLKCITHMKYIHDYDAVLEREQGKCSYHQAVCLGPRAYLASDLYPTQTLKNRVQLAVSWGIQQVQQYHVLFFDVFCCKIPRLLRLQ